MKDVDFAILVFIVIAWLEVGRPLRRIANALEQLAVTAFANSPDLRRVALFLEMFDLAKTVEKIREPQSRD